MPAAEAKAPRPRPPHGVPDVANAHPQSSSDKKIALVHNGIIENAEGVGLDNSLIAEARFFRAFNYFLLV